MPKQDRSTHTGDIVRDAPELSLDDLCTACGLSREQITAYAVEGVIEPKETEPVRWRFSHLSLVQLRRAARLEHDLGLNVPGVALALDLISQVETLKRQLARFEQQEESSQ